MDTAVEGGTGQRPRMAKAMWKMTAKVKEMRSPKAMALWKATAVAKVKDAGDGPIEM